MSNHFGHLFNRKAAIIIVLVIILILLISLFGIFTSSYAADQDEVSNFTLDFVDTNEWVDQRHDYEIKKLKLPVDMVVMLHSASDYCEIPIYCQYHFVNTENYVYNFMINKHGTVYIVRGWENQGAFTNGTHLNSIGIDFVHSSKTFLPTKYQLTAFKYLIKEGIGLGKIAPDYTLYAAPHREMRLRKTDEFFSKYKDWPNFSKEVPERDWHYE